MELKTLPFYLISIVASFLFGLFTINLITSAKILLSIDDFINLILPICLSLFVLVLFFSFLLILITKKSYWLTGIILTSLGFLIGIVVGSQFDQAFVVLILVLSVGFLLSLVLTRFSLYKSYNNQIEPNIGSAIVNGTKDLLFVMALVIAVGSYLYTNSDKYKTEVKNQFVAFVTEYSVGMISTTINNEINDLVESNLEQIGSNNTNAKQLLETINENLKSSLGIELPTANLNKLSSDLLNQKQIEIDISSTIKPLISERVESIISPYLKYLPVFFALITYFTLTTFFFLIRLLLSPFSNLLSFTLIKAGYVTESEETVVIKRLSLKA